MGSGRMKAIMEERVFAIRHEQEAVPVTNLCPQRRQRLARPFQPVPGAKKEIPGTDLSLVPPSLRGSGTRRLSNQRPSLELAKARRPTQTGENVTTYTGSRSRLNEAFHWGMWKRPARVQARFNIEPRRERSIWLFRRSASGIPEPIMARGDATLSLTPGPAVVTRSDVAGL
jgi:hypothetical protein